MRRGIHSTEFVLTVLCLVGGALLIVFRWPATLDGVLLASAGVLSYALSRGIAKAGYGRAVTRDPPRRI